MVGCPSLSMLDFLFYHVGFGPKKKRTDMNRQVISKVLFGIFRSSVIRRPTCLLKKTRKGEALFLGQRVPT